MSLTPDARSHQMLDLNKEDVGQGLALASGWCTIVVDTVVEDYCREYTEK